MWKDVLVIALRAAAMLLMLGAFMCFFQPWANGHFWTGVSFLGWSFACQGLLPQTPRS